MKGRVVIIERNKNWASITGSIIIETWHLRNYPELKFIIIHTVRIYAFIKIEVKLSTTNKKTKSKRQYIPLFVSLLILHKMADQLWKPIKKKYNKIKQHLE